MVLPRASRKAFSKDEAETIKKKFTEAGAVVEVKNRASAGGFGMGRVFHSSPQSSVDGKSR